MGTALKWTENDKVGCSKPTLLKKELLYELKSSTVKTEHFLSKFPHICVPNDYGSVFRLYRILSPEQLNVELCGNLRTLCNYGTCFSDFISHNPHISLLSLWHSMNARKETLAHMKHENDEPFVTTIYRFTIVVFPRHNKLHPYIPSGLNWVH